MWHTRLAYLCPMVSEVSPGETRISERVLNNGTGSSFTCLVPGLRWHESWPGGLSTGVPTCVASYVAGASSQPGGAGVIRFLTWRVRAPRASVLVN